MGSLPQQVEDCDEDDDDFLLVPGAPRAEFAMTIDRAAARSREDDRTREWEHRIDDEFTVPEPASFARGLFDFARMLWCSNRFLNARACSWPIKWRMDCVELESVRAKSNNALFEHGAKAV